jgi:hypothetical protein
LKKQQWRAAFGELFALLIFHEGHDNHLHDHEMHCVRASFVPDWFAALSRQWRAVLARSDAELGLAPEKAVAGGYRARLERVLATWQRSVNDTLSATDEQYHDVEPPRVDIFSAEQEAQLADPREKDEEEEEEEEEEE